MPDEIEPNPSPDPPTSVKPAKGKKTEREIALEIQLSEFQDRENTLKARTSELEGLLEGARKAPSARLPGKTLLDELNDFLDGTI